MKLASLALAAARGAPSIRGWAAYLHGERLAERDPAAAMRHLTDAVAAAEEVDDRFLAGVARHTLMTTAARMDEAGHAVSSFAGLLDQWNASGAWTQVWLTMRALICSTEARSAALGFSFRYSSRFSITSSHF